jgi:hypothetical protein
VAGLTATEATAPIPTNSRGKDDAATRVLAEGATGEDFGSEEAIDRLPDRILETQGKSDAEEEESDLTSMASAEAPYDATRDPRTGRPPTPLEAQRLARENELERLRQAQTPDEVAELYEDGHEGGGGEESDDTLSPEEPDELASGDESGGAQGAARMTSPDLSEEERTAVDDLVEQGVVRGRADELVKEHGANNEKLKAALISENLPNERQDEREQ